MQIFMSGLIIPLYNKVARDTNTSLFHDNPTSLISENILAWHNWINCYENAIWLICLISITVFNRHPIKITFRATLILLEENYSKELVMRQSRMIPREKKLGERRTTQ